MRLTTDFLRMWQYCPMQALLCAVHGDCPLSIVTRGCISRALSKCLDKRRKFQPEHLSMEFDQEYSAQASHLDLRTFAANGTRALNAANKLAATLVRALEGGWTILGAETRFTLDLAEDNLLGSEGHGHQLIHTVDMVLRDPYKMTRLASFSPTSLVKFEAQRELFRSLDVQLNHLVTRVCAREPTEMALISIFHEQVLVWDASAQEGVRILSELHDTILGVNHHLAPHRTVSGVYCQGCPVQSLCDDPKVHDIIVRKGVLL